MVEIMLKQQQFNLKILHCPYRSCVALISEDVHNQSSKRTQDERGSRHANKHVLKSKHTSNSRVTCHF